MRQGGGESCFWEGAGHDTPLMKGIPDWGNTRAAVTPERVKINISVTIKIMRYASDYNYLCHCSYFWQLI